MHRVILPFHVVRTAVLHTCSMYLNVHVLCCFALFVCLTLLASFFLPSHLSFKNMYINVHVMSAFCLPHIISCTVSFLFTYPIWQFSLLPAFPHLLHMQVCNFNTSFSDGRLLCYLIHHYHPSLLPLNFIQNTTTLSEVSALCMVGLHGRCNCSYLK